jgi:hypothetical protein
MARRVRSIKKMGIWAVGTLEPAWKPETHERDRYYAQRDATADFDRRSESSAGFWLALRDFTREPILNPDDLVLEFVNLNREDDEHALTFMQMYGVFDPAHRAHAHTIRQRGAGQIDDYADTPPDEVCTFLDSAQPDHSETFAVSLMSFWDVRYRTRKLLALDRALQSRDYGVIEAICRDLRCKVEVENERDWLETGRKVLCMDISAELDVPGHGVSLVATQLGGVVVAGASSLTLRPTLFLGALSQITKGTPIGECGNAKCRKLFLLTRDTKKFCSKRCYALAKVNRHRALPLATSAENASQSKRVK